MKRTIITAFAIVTFLSLSTISFAQSGSSAPPPPPPAAPSGGGGGGATGGGGGGDAPVSDDAALASALSSSGVSGGGSLQAGILSGQSAIIRSQGQAFYLNALAASQYEEARRAYLENQKLAWQQQREYHAWKAAKKEESQICKETGRAKARKNARGEDGLQVQLRLA